MRGPLWPYILLAGLCALLFFWRLGATPLMGLDEGLYAECAREMLATGDYVVPACNGEPFFDKPPVSYWLQAASMRAFGVNSFAARLPSAVEELLLVAFTVLLGTRFFGRRAGLMAGFALATSLVTVGVARMAILDAAFALAITASLGAFLLAYAKLAPRWVYLAFWAAMGLSAMVKGPAGPALILATVLTFLLIRRDLKAIISTLPLAGLCLALAIALPWYVLVEQRTGGAFLREFIFHQNLDRALGADFQHNAKLWFYPLVFLVGFFPWSVFLPAALLQSRSFGVRRDPPLSVDGGVSQDLSGASQHPEPVEGSDSRSGNPETCLFLTVWIAVIFVIFSALPSKLPAYIFPIYPPSALLVAVLWSRAREEENSTSPGSTHPLVLSSPRSGRIEGRVGTSIWRSALAAAILACLIGAAMLIAPSHLREPIPGLSAALIPMAVCLICGCAAGWLLLLAKRGTAAFVALCCGIGGFALVAVELGLPIAVRPNAQPAAEIAQVISQTPRPSPSFTARFSPRTPPVVAFNLSPPQPALGFYAGRAVPRIDTPGQLRDALRARPDTLIVAQTDRREGLPPQTEVLARIGPYILVKLVRSSR